VVLGFDTLSEYEERSPFFGCITGRYANRIAGGSFQLDGKTYPLAVNNGPNHLHGGLVGFDKKVWRARTEKSDESLRLILSHTSPDGDEGYPGTLACEVTYSWNNRDELRIDYTATTDAPTVINLTNHSYFNLAGHGSGPVLEHLLKLEADAFTPADATAIPTGERRAVEGTPFDFRSAQSIGARIGAADQQIEWGLGYDHNFIVNGPAGRLRPCAELSDPASGRVMTVQTTEPGVQVYSANFLNALPGKGGAVYPKRGGLCLETQHFPDSPHQPDFPSTVLRPGETFRSSTVFGFSTR
jgi:aldose 1-epimerase